MNDPAYPSVTPTPTDELEDLRKLVHELWARKWWIVLGAVVGAAVLGSVALFTTPVFRATAVLIPATADRSNLSGSLNSALGQLNGIASLVGVNIAGSGDSATEEAIAVMQSRRFSEAFITDHSLVPKLLSSTGAALNPDSTDDSPAARGKAWRVFDDNIRFVDRDRKSGLVILRIEWHDRLEAAAWANELVNRLNAEMRQRSVAATDASIEFLRKELKTTSEVEIQMAINRLIEVQIRQRMLATVTPEFAFRVVDYANPPDADDPLRPKRGLLFVLGTLLGTAVATAAVYIRHTFWNR